MDELEMIVSLDERITTLPDRFIKIILSEKTSINPLTKEYYVSGHTELSFGKYKLMIHSENNKIRIRDMEVIISDSLVHISVINSNILVQVYPNLRTFKEKYGISRQNPKY